jgi:hypothetical protein
MGYNNWDTIPETNYIAQMMALVRINAELLASGDRLQMIVTGGAGVGKTHGINLGLDLFRARGLDPIHANPSSYKELLEAFEDAQSSSNGKPSRVRPIFFDEADSIFASTKMLNILKVAFAPNRRDRVYHGQRLDAPVAISTNRDLEYFTAHKSPHFAALFDRVPPIVVRRDLYASWEYACYLALKTKMNRMTNAGRAVSLDVQVRALEWFTENALNLKVVGPRALHQIIETLAMKLPTSAEEIELQQLLQSRQGEFSRVPEQQDWKALMMATSGARLRMA